MAADISTVLLDADGVVQTTIPGWIDAVKALCGIPDRADEFLQAVFAAEQPALTGHCDFQIALAEVLNRWQSPAKIDEALAVWHLIEPEEAILDRVAELRSRGVRVSLATNQQAHRAEFMTRVLGYEHKFDDLFYSCDLGYRKPDVNYFRAITARLGQAGSELLFLDDGEPNVLAARAAGLHAEIYELTSGESALIDLLDGYGLISRNAR